MFDPRVKPEFGSATIDWHHPLAQGLLGLWLFNEGAGKIVRNLAMNPEVGVMSANTNWGNGVLVHRTTSDKTTLITEAAVPTTSITVSLGYRKTDSTARASNAFGVDAVTTTGRCNAHLPFSDSSVIWDFGGITSGTSRLIASGLSFGDDAWSFTAGPGMGIWQNGIRRASQGSSATRSVVGSATGWKLGWTASLSDLAEYRWLALHKAGLDADRIGWLHAEPYAMMMPVRRVHFSFPPQMGDGWAGNFSGGWSGNWA